MQFLQMMEGRILVSQESPLWETTSLSMWQQACIGPRHAKALWLLQGFRSAEEVQRFSDMMDEMCYIVATKHSGSLKVRCSPMLGSHRAPQHACGGGAGVHPEWLLPEEFAVATDWQHHERGARRAQAAARCIWLGLCLS